MQSLEYRLTQPMDSNTPSKFTTLIEFKLGAGADRDGGSIEFSFGRNRPATVFEIRHDGFLSSVNSETPFTMQFLPNVLHRLAVTGVIKDKGGKGENRLLIYADGKALCKVARPGYHTNDPGALESITR